MKQPAVGIIATVLVMAIALGFISLFSYATFTGWVSYYLMCIIPMQLVLGVTWATKLPAFAGARRQPAKGILLTLTALATGVVVSLAYWVVAGARVNPPAPMLVQCTITSVAITFWATIMWGGWPFTRFIKNPVAAGLILLVVSYAVNYILFRLLFDYAFMQGAPVYVASLDPHGPFNAWSVLVYYMCALCGLFLMLLFDLWPFTTSPNVMKQPTLGIVWTVFSLVLGAIAYEAAVAGFGMDPVAWMVSGPVAFIFGTIVVTNMLQGSLFGSMKQPLKGILNLAAAIVIGEALLQLYLALAPVVTGNMNPGPPAYEREIWTASAMLAVTFPFLVIYAEFFKFWPLKKEA
jgi:hypothetical protein